MRLRQFVILVGAWAGACLAPTSSLAELAPVQPLRTLTAADFTWTPAMRRHEDFVVSTVNQIHQKVEGCRQIDPSSTYLSGQSAEPFGFVTCGSGRDKFNVLFSRKGVRVWDVPGGRWVSP